MLNDPQPLMILAYIITGLFAGLTGGLLGLGGGIIIVPVLHYLFLMQGFPDAILMHLAVTTSLVTIIFTSMASTWSHHRKRAVLWPVVLLLVPGILAGGFLGAWLADQLSSNYLRIGFGVFELFVAIQIGSGMRPSPHRTLPRAPGMVVTGAGIGTLSTLLGIGGGTLTVPVLLWCNVNVRNAVAVSAACGMPIAIAGSIAMIYAGLNEPLLPEKTIGYLYWPAASAIILATVIAAPIGVRLAHILPTEHLKKIFALVLAIVGVRMLM